MAAAEDQSGAPAAQTDSGVDEKWTMKQTSSAVIEIHDSVTEYEEEEDEEEDEEKEENKEDKMERKEDEASSAEGQPEEKAFVLSLHLFMKEKGSPIERIPHLGFKQINLWRIYKAVEKRGGYDLVTAQRLWKKVYDELGGSPGSTSAATCTRRHYERLVLPFERHMKGEEDKPLPPSKPRKPYKRNLENKVKKSEIKRERCHLDEDVDSHVLAQRNPGPASHAEAVMRLHSGLWPSPADRQFPKSSQPNRDICSSVYAILPVHSSLQPAPPPPVASPAAAAEVISPLEKKKRMAQASLNRPTSPQGEEKERPSVICCSQSPARAFTRQNCSSSEGSPQPLSSSSSRSPSPLSVSSEDSHERGEDKSALNPEMIRKQLKCVGKKSICSENNQSPGCPQVPKSSVAPNKDITPVKCQTFPPYSSKCRDKDSAWEPLQRVSSKYPHYPFHPTSSSSFYKVIPRSAQPLRPAAIRPSYHDEPHSRKLTSVDPWFHQTEKKEKSWTGSQKLPHQQVVAHSATQLPMLCVLSGYDKPVRDSRPLPPLQPLFLPNRMRMPASQLVYHHRPPLGPVPPAMYPYPYTVPLTGSYAGYPLPAINPTYTQKI